MGNMDGHQTTIGDVRAALRKCLGTDLRQARNGKFYSMQDFIDWYSRDGSPAELQDLRRLWLEGQSFQKPLALVLSNGYLIAEDANNELLSRLVCDIPLLPCDPVLYNGPERRVSGSTLVEGTTGKVMPSSNGRFRVQFKGVGTVFCQSDEVIACCATDSLPESSEGVER